MMNQLYEQTILLIQQKALSRLSDEELERMVAYLSEIQKQGQINNPEVPVVKYNLPPKVVFDTVLYERARRMWDKE